MPNLVGIGNSQVPTNAMLGGLAYQDSVGEINLDKIKAKTIGTAIDIFVYDTRKDSDGGAWRYRTQNKSWYNEGASEYRGARKEFPSIAVLVLESNYLKIYDGDDPNLSMWMVFNSNSGSMCRAPTPSSVAMLNAKLVVGESNNYAGSTIDFIMDSKDVERDLRQVRWNGNIASRNDTGLVGDFSSRLAIGQHTNDVAMIVLPNAPIDQVTGLPIPTIAVATDQGFTVIKDTTPVTVAHKKTTGDEGHQVAWLGTSKLVATSPTYYGIFNDPLVHESSDLGYLSSGAESAYSPFSSSTWRNTPHPIASLSTNSKLITIDDRTIVATTDAGLNIHELSRNSIVDNNDGMVAFVTKDYNTGWQIGDIKGTFFSDTDDTNITGSELVTNGDFSANSNWAYQGGTTSFNISSGKLNYDGSGTIYLKAYQNITGLTVGQKYVLSINLTSISSHNISFAFATSNIGNTLLASTVSTTGTHSITYTATQANISVYIQTNNATMTFSVDDVSLRIAEEDRSVNDNGLQVFGTITKEPVAFGAELVAYSGFSASNYLKQPYNSDLDFGTGDFSIMFWYKLTSTGTAQCFIHRGDGGSGTWGSGNLIQIEMDTSHMEFQIGGPSFSPLNETKVAVDVGATGAWQHFAGVRKDGYMHVYIDGVKYGNTASTQNVTNTSATLWVGERPNASRPATNTSMALLRMSSTVPSDEQIKKIYYDEKCLFHEKAKCTLHGTSDDVKTVAFDDTSNILHVGTSGGRSDFRGLNRINNTTTAVTTVISASNELVAEQ